MLFVFFFFQINSLKISQIILRAPCQYVGKVARKEERTSAENRINSVMYQFCRLKKENIHVFQGNIYQSPSLSSANTIQDQLPTS